jgi:hypothetical protein
MPGAREARPWECPRFFIPNQSETAAWPRAPQYLIENASLARISREELPIMTE